MSGALKSQTAKNPKHKEESNGTTFSRAITKDPMECYDCNLPLFEPRPACAFCGRGACTDHLRKLRTYPHQQTIIEEIRSDYNFDLRPICDQCQDFYLFSKLMEQPDLAFELKALADTEEFSLKDEQRMLQKCQGAKAQLKAKQLKLDLVRAQKDNGFQDVQAKAREAAQIQAKILHEWQTLDDFERLLEDAQGQLKVLQSQPFISLQNDFNILSAESSKLTKDLLKLDKNMGQIKQNIRKVETDIQERYNKWEKKQQEKKSQGKGNQKPCVLF